jgi:hypothetical protein
MKGDKGGTGVHEVKVRGFLVCQGKHCCVQSIVSDVFLAARADSALIRVTVVVKGAEGALEGGGLSVYGFAPDGLHPAPA